MILMFMQVQIVHLFKQYIERDYFNHKHLNRLKGIIYDWVCLLACLGFRQKNKQQKLLIIRIDEIGDYMLWRNFLNEISSSPTYRNHEIHFCGNKSWKALFTHFDQTAVHTGFWIDKIKFKTELRYRFRFLRMIYRQGYETVINPTFSRDKRYDDSIVKASKATYRIGMVSNKESIHAYELGYDKDLYTSLFHHSERPLFEFLRNKLFTAFVTGIPSAVENTQVPSALLPDYKGIAQPYFVVFPGSRSKSRIWPTAHFIQVASYLFKTRGYTAVVCGASGDQEYTKAFCNQYSFPVLDLTGKTTLPEMLTVLKNASLLLSVDTGAVHLAAAVGCTVVGIFNGSQYKRFAPYPTDINKHFYPIYPNSIEEDLQKEDVVRSKYEFVVDIPYATVTAEKVIQTIDRYFGNE